MFAGSSAVRCDVDGEGIVNRGEIGEGIFIESDLSLSTSVDLGKFVLAVCEERLENLTLGTILFGCVGLIGSRTRSGVSSAGSRWRSSSGSSGNSRHVFSGTVSGIATN